ncbi:gamma-glutamyltransferase [Nostoc sp. NIES-2111]
MAVSPGLGRGVAARGERLRRGGADGWGLVPAAPGARIVQLELAILLDRIAKERAAAFYFGPMAQAVSDAVARNGGVLDRADLAAHHTVLPTPSRSPGGDCGFWCSRPSRRAFSWRWR